MRTGDESCTRVCRPEPGYARGVTHLGCSETEAVNGRLYVMAGFSAYDQILERLGTYKTGKSCLYVKRLDDIDLDVLRELIAASLDYL